MQVRAPKMHARLRKAGTLERTRGSRGAASEAFQIAIGRQGSPYDRAQAMDSQDHLKRMGAIEAARSAAAEQANAIAIEFPEEASASEESADPSQSLPRD